MGDSSRMDRNYRFMEAFNEAAVASCSIKPGDTLIVKSTGLGELDGMTSGVGMYAVLQSASGQSFGLILQEYGELFESDDSLSDAVERISSTLSLDEAKVREMLVEADLD
jgi:hypothetical protein